jgi:hypothetical protein
VVPDVHRDDLFSFYQKLKGDTVGQVYGERAPSKTGGFEPVQAKRWVIRVEFQQLQGPGVLDPQIGMFLQEPGYLHFIAVGKITYFSLSQTVMIMTSLSFATSSRN